MASNPTRARLSAEAKAAKRAEQRLPTAEEAFGQPPLPPAPEPMAVLPRDMDIVPDPDSPEFDAAGHSRKLAPYNPYSPPVLRGEIRRRALEKDREIYLKGLDEGSPTWTKMSLVLEAKHGSKANNRIRALELIAKINQMFIEKVEVRGQMSPEQQELAVKKAVENLLAKVGPDLRVLPASAEVCIEK